MKSCVSPDSQFLASGSEDGVVYIWDIATSISLTNDEIDVNIEGPVSCVVWNPVYHLMAVSGRLS